MEIINQYPYADPTNLPQLRDILKQADPENRLHPIGMQKIEIGSGALHRVPTIVAAIASDNRIVMVVDATPMTVHGEALKTKLFELMSSQFHVAFVELGSGETLLHADEKAISQAKEAIADHGCVVVVGSGTIVDICKDATYQTDKKLVVVQTAASVNAFSDNMAVLLKEGVKRTVPSRWPDALIIDLDVIAEAPRAMNIAGFGDLLAMWTAPADWYLAHVTGMNQGYHPAPAGILRDQGNQLLESAESLKHGELEALDLVSRLITLSGISLGVAGSTGALSGTEHLVSHLIDMSAEQSHLPLALHGAQVGVSTLFVSTAWKFFLEEFDPTQVSLETLFPDENTMKTMVFDAFNKIDPSGRVAEECWKDYRLKLKSWKECRPQIESFLSNWEHYHAELGQMAAAPERLSRALREAGAPVKFSQLEPAIPPETARWALNNCHLMRNRFTLSDLLFYLGWWNERFIQRVITHVQSLGGGL
jgi:glycerol-1-phosphate dehydrogenase [NAD(P)+]